MAVVLVFQSGLVDARTAQWFDVTTSQLGAAVGMSASVAPTEYNAITAELTRQQQLLAAREETIAEREITLARNEEALGTDQHTRVTYILVAVVALQLVLLLLNYVLDARRSRYLAPQPAQ